MTYYDIVMKLVGPVAPVGDAAIDEQRLDNLKELTQLVDGLIFDIDAIATDNKDSHEASRRKAGQHCSNFLDSLGIED